MDTTAALGMGVAGMAAGWFIPFIAFRLTELRLRGSGGTISAEINMRPFLLKLTCLLLNGALWAAVGMFADNFLQAFLLAVILFDAELIVLIDIRIHIIPNETVLIMALAGLILQASYNGIASLGTGLLTALAVMAVFLALGNFLGLHTIGAGDVKLAGAMGLMLGFPGIMYGLLGMGVLLILWCLGGLITRRLSMKSMLAFGPFMMAGTVFAIAAKITGP